MSSIERTQSQTHYKETDLKDKLAKTRSCPSNGTKSRRSQSSILSNSSNVPKLPPNFRNNSITGITSLASKDLELSAVESSTSSSLIHGIILVVIMLSSLMAFVCSKIKRPCDQSDQMMSFELNSSDHHYCQLSVLFFSVITIISCLISFIIYFLHLIGQCDHSWIVNKKFTIEMIVISILVILLITANTLMLKETIVLDLSIGIFSIICSTLAITGYIIRITKLWTESKTSRDRNINRNREETKIDETKTLTLMKESFKNNLNNDSNKFWDIPQSVRDSNALNQQNFGSPLRVVSYVKRKKSVDSTVKSISHNNNNNTNSYDMDVEDDVFIN